MATVDKDVAVSLIGGGATVVTAVLGYFGTRLRKGGPSADDAGDMGTPDAKPGTSPMVIAVVAVVSMLVGGGAAYFGQKTLPDPGGDRPTTAASPPGPTVPTTTTTVPPLVGLDQAAADTAVVQAGLTAQFDSVDGTAPPGQVVAVTPAAGTSVTRGSTVRVELSRGPGCPTGVVEIRSVASGKVLRVPGNATTPVVVVQDADSGGTDAFEQWQFEPSGDGWYAIRGIGSGLALTVTDARAADHTPVQTFNLRGEDNQLWQCVVDGTGYQIATRLDSAMVIDVPGGSTANGVQMQIYTSRRGAQNQQWQFLPVG